MQWGSFLLSLFAQSSDMTVLLGQSGDDILIVFMNDNFEVSNNVFSNTLNQIQIF